MEKPEIQQLVAELLKENNAQLLSQVNESISGAVARVQKDTEKKLSEVQPKDESKEGSLELQTLKQQLEQLQNEREADKKSAIAAQREAALLSDLGSRQGLKATNLLKQLLISQYGESLEQENGKWYVKSGETTKELKSVVDDFLKSEDGLVFMPPASSVKGADSQRGNTKTKPEKAKDLSQLIEESLSKK